MISTYSPKKVSVTWGPVFLTGFSEGTVVKAKRRTNTYDLKVGADGFSARTQSADQSGEITVSLMATSPANDLLWRYATADELLGASYFPMLIKDLSGRTVLSAPNCWVAAWPDVDFEKEANAREWMFNTDVLQMVLVGGNS